jgi:hypothetical protein
MKGFKRRLAPAAGVGLGVMIGVGVLAVPSFGWGKEIAFVAREVEDLQAVWLPREIVIHRSTDFTEPLIFRFDNPTARTHVFEAPALFEFVDEGGIRITRPLRITIPPEGTEQTVIDRDRMASDAMSAEGETVTYRFYCPLHRADSDMGGRIVVGR